MCNLPQRPNYRMINNIENRAALEQLITSKHPCVFISTFEERYVTGLISEIVSDLADCDYWFWTINKGLHAGWFDASWFDSPSTQKDTENPAAAIYSLLDQLGTKRSVSVFVDLLAHLSDERTLRLLRDLISRHKDHGGTVVLIDHRDDLPPVIGAYTHRFVPALPDEAELRRIVRATLRRIHSESPIKVKLKRNEMATLMKNLAGLSRRQVETIITECVADDRELSAADINHVLAAKRQALHADGLLQYIETPVDLDQVGGLKRL